jgi:DNA repair protein RecN (Recombination protein N)
MLQKIHIQNYAIIEEIETDFSSKLNIITGETGAGKSIVVGALSLILGERADTSILLKNDKKCCIEGWFDVADNTAVQQFFQTQEFDYSNELVLRREIATNGKSRAFINDTPATLQQLKQLASLLVDLHQQFDTLELGDTNFQRTVLDALANQAETIVAYQSIFKQWMQAKQNLAALQNQKASFTKEADYNQFLFDELNELNLQENELENLDLELKTLSNSEGIKGALNRVYHELKESEQPIVTALKQLSNQLNAFANYHSELPVIITRLQSNQIELQDIADELERLNDHIVFDEKRIAIIDERMALGYKLLKKHGVQTTNELITIQQDLEQKLQAILNIDDAIAAKEKETAQLYNEALQKATSISIARQQQINPFEEKVNGLLFQVGMPNAKLKVELKETDLQFFGKDTIEFLFDANKSNKFEPIKKVASGGELSRLMLCIKSLVAERIDLPTMIFDEIDSGISGEAAKQVGSIMKGLATCRQIICITHQPQIAGKADAHFFVYKEVVGNTIKTNVKILSQNERINAIAQMLSGEKPTAAALENAREMVMQ